MSLLKEIPDLEYFEVNNSNKTSDFSVFKTVLFPKLEEIKVVGFRNEKTDEIIRNEADEADFSLQPAL